MLRVAAIAFLLATVVPAAGAASRSGFAFGRIGGNIIPYTVTIGADGRVRVSGPVQARKTSLTVAELRGLARIVSAARFASLPVTTSCPATLPDVAATFVRVGGRTVRVHGACVARYNRVFRALSRAARLKPS